jgi:hypothetical protein
MPDSNLLELQVNELKTKLQQQSDQILLMNDEKQRKL